AWAKTIKSKVVSGEMPPWGADPRYGVFGNDRHLTKDQVDVVVAWVDGGAPKGHDADLPRPPAMVEGWLAGTEPDYIIQSPVEFHVPAEGELNMLNFYTPVAFKEDKFTRFLEWRPGNRTVVHHGVASVGDLPPGSTLDQDGALIYSDGTRENDFGTQVPQRRRAGTRFSLVVDYDPGR